MKINQIKIVDFEDNEKYIIASGCKGLQVKNIERRFSLQICSLT